jgi:predicted nucleotidyltransferase
MKIDPSQPICDVRPSTLKALLRKEEFSVETAAKLLKLPKALASDRLRELEREGWVQPLQSDSQSSEDLWTSTMTGARLAASHLSKRFSVSIGRSIVQKVIGEARRINTEIGNSRRITKITLFGSVLAGGVADDAGDVDLVVETAYRKMPLAERCKLEEAERASMSRSRSVIDGLFWSQTLLLRRVKRVSNKISLHDRSDLDAFPEMPRQLVYDYDIDAERERPS